MDRIWRDFGGWPLVATGVGNRSLPLDVEQDDNNVVVSASLPGVRPEDIQVTTEDGVLTIEAEAGGDSESKEGDYLIRERRNGSYHRSVRLPDNVDADKGVSSYEHGVLTISFPKQEAKKPKRLEIKVGS
jgi:HSP20 family protein